VPEPQLALHKQSKRVKLFFQDSGLFVRIKAALNSRNAIAINERATWGCKEMAEDLRFPHICQKSFYRIALKKSRISYHQ
jgi:hypothetical protein